MYVCLDRKLVARYGFILLVISGGVSVAAQEPHDAHAGHAQTGDQGIPATRDGSGTSWLPDESPMYAVHAQSKGWMFMGHGAAFLQYLRESGDRGNEQTGSINWLMGMARRDLGAGHLRTLYSIVVPLALPGIISGIIITFVPALGAYLTPDLLGGPDSQMIANVIERQFKRANDWPFGAALSFLLMYATFGAIAMRAYFSRGKPADGHGI